MVGTPSAMITPSKQTCQDSTCTPAVKVPSASKVKIASAVVCAVNMRCRLAAFPAQPFLGAGLSVVPRQRHDYVGRTSVGQEISKMSTGNITIGVGLSIVFFFFRYIVAVIAMNLNPSGPEPWLMS